MYGRRIKEVRHVAKMNQTEFADALGIPQSTLSNYEREISEPSFDILNKICSLFNVDADWLLGFTDYHNLLLKTYDDFADLVSCGFTVDESYRMTQQKLNRYGDMVMKLNYEYRKAVEKFCRQLLVQQESAKNNNNVKWVEPVYKIVFRD